MARIRASERLIQGNSDANVLTSSSSLEFHNESFRGKEGNDTIVGGRGQDRIIFEADHAINGTDRIMDFQVRSSDGRWHFDVLDLSQAIGSRNRIGPSTIDRYVWVQGDRLFVDPNGKKTASSPWAILNGVKTGDLLRVFTGRYEGWITAGEPPAPSYITVDNKNAWADSDEDGKLDSDETTLTPVVDPITGLIKFQGVDVSAANVTVRFTSGLRAATITGILDLTGFGSGDKLIIDGSTSKGTYYGFSESAGAPSRSNWLQYTGTKLSNPRPGGQTYRAAIFAGSNNNLPKFKAGIQLYADKKVYGTATAKISQAAAYFYKTLTLATLAGASGYEIQVITP